VTASPHNGRRQPADQVTMRRNNLALVLRHLRDAGPRSRARISVETGLNRGTVSSLVAELIDRGLVRDGDVQRGGSVGRPGQTVELDGRGIGGIGVEINVDYVTALVLDLADTVVFDHNHNIGGGKDANGHTLGVGMPCAIGQRLLNHAINACLLRISQVIRSALDTYGGRDAGVPRKFTPLPLQRRFESDVVQHRGPQPHGEVTDCSHRVGIQPSGIFQAVFESVAFRVAESAQISQFHRKRCHHLTDFIVQFAGQGCPFDFLRLYETL
jgi:hypothetical protein